MEIEETILYSKTIRDEKSIVHITDAHIALADERDSDMERSFAKERTESFHARNTFGYDAVKAFEDAIAMAKAEADLTVFTGDIIDSVI